MGKNVYVVNWECLTGQGVYYDMNAVFSTMEKAKKYIASEIHRLDGTDIIVTYNESNYYEIKFINTYTNALKHQIKEEVCAYATEHEIDIED